MNLIAKPVWILLLSLLAVPALAVQLPDGNEGGHGGDEVSLEFLEAFDRAWTFVRRSPSPVFAEIRSEELEAIVKGARILTVDEPLFVEWGNHRQESAAVNFRRAKVIKVNRARWAAIPSPAVKASLALHEVLGLAGLEQTGNYPYSGQYLAMAGGGHAPDPDLAWPKLPEGAQMPAELAKVFTYECRLTFMEGEGVSRGGVACPPGQRLGFLYAGYPYYFARTRFEDALPPADEAYFDGSFCEYPSVPRYVCQQEGQLDFGLAKNPEGHFSFPVEMKPGPDSAPVRLGYAAPVDAAGSCPSGLVEARRQVAQPKSITAGSIDGQNPPSNFLNHRGSLNAHKIVLSGIVSSYLNVERWPNKVPCETSHSDPAPRPAPGSCVDSEVGLPYVVQAVAYERSEPAFCVVPRAAIRP